jgi:hypothetical protein
MKDQTVENIVQNEPPPYESLLNNTNASGKILSPPQWESINNNESTQSIIDARVTPILPINQIESYRVWSIVNILLCCSCLGCIACSFSMDTENFKKNGDIQGALNASKDARRMNIIATIVGTLIIITYVVYQMRNF